MTTDSNDVLGGNAQSKLKGLVERLLRLHEDRDAVAADLKEVYAEAKGEGFDTKIVRKAIAKLRRDSAKAAEEEALLDLYMAALVG